MHTKSALKSHIKATIMQKQGHQCGWKTSSAAPAGQRNPRRPELQSQMLVEAKLTKLAKLGHRAVNSSSGPAALSPWHRHQMDGHHQSAFRIPRSRACCWSNWCGTRGGYAVGCPDAHGVFRRARKWGGHDDAQPNFCWDVEEVGAREPGIGAGLGVAQDFLSFFLVCCHWTYTRQPIRGKLQHVSTLQS